MHVPLTPTGARSLKRGADSCWRRQTFTPTIQPMSYFDTNKQRASALIIALGVFLAIALWPFASGLLGAPVLYIIFAPVYRRLAERLPDGLAAAIVIVLAILLVVLPVASIVSLLATQGPGMVRGVVESPLVDKLRDLRIGPYNVGEQVSTQFRNIGSRLLTVAGSSALGILGSLTRLTLQLTITFFGLYYLLRAPRRAWRQIRAFIPFSSENAEKLKARFKEVTISTLIGTFLTAAVQGVLLGIAFWITGLANPVFWSVMTALFSVLPVVGSGLIWIPGVIVLFLEQRYGWAIFLAVWGMVVIGGIDNLIRPWVYRRYAQIHPFVTVIGAFAGLKYFGILGLLIGPLAISYFFELIRMYREEHLEHEIEPEPEEPPRVRRRLSWPGRRAGDAPAG
jgi:predicted PurR-regulated permease PerM